MMVYENIIYIRLLRGVTGGLRPIRCASRQFRPTAYLALRDLLYCELMCATVS